MDFIIKFSNDRSPKPFIKIFKSFFSFFLGNHSFENLEKFFQFSQRNPFNKKSSKVFSAVAKVWAVDCPKRPDGDSLPLLTNISLDILRPKALQNFGQCLIAHLAVNIATGNTNNQVEFVLTSALTGAAVIPQTYLEVAEYNAGFSYASTGLGASSAPVFVNAGGVVTIPAAGF